MPILTLENLVVIERAVITAGSENGITDMSKAFFDPNLGNRERNMFARLSVVDMFVLRSRIIVNTHLTLGNTDLGK